MSPSLGSVAAGFALVGAAFPLADARRAYEHKAARGKVVLTMVGQVVPHGRG